LKFNAAVAPSRDAAVNLSDKLGILAEARGITVINTACDV
jgi:hypothetical protein